MKKITPLKAIRNYCLNCVERTIDVKVCPTIECSLWKFRLGIHPFTKKNCENPFLDTKNFKGLHYMNNDEVIKHINNLK